MGFFIEGSSNGIGNILKKLKILRVLRMFKIVNMLIIYIYI